MQTELPRSKSHDLLDVAPSPHANISDDHVVNFPSPTFSGDACSSEPQPNQQHRADARSECSSDFCSCSDKSERSDFSVREDSAVGSVSAQHSHEEFWDEKEALSSMSSESNPQLSPRAGPSSFAFFGRGIGRSMLGAAMESSVSMASRFWRHRSPPPPPPPLPPDVEEDERRQQQPTRMIDDSVAGDEEQPSDHDDGDDDDDDEEASQHSEDELERFGSTNGEGVLSASNLSAFSLQHEESNACTEEDAATGESQLQAFLDRIRSVDEMIRDRVHILRSRGEEGGAGMGLINGPEWMRDVRDRQQVRDEVNGLISQTMGLRHMFPGLSERFFSRHRVVGTDSGEGMISSLIGGSAAVFGRVSHELFPFFQDFVVETWDFLREVLEYYDPDPKYNVFLRLIDKVNEVIAAIQSLYILSECYFNELESLEANNNNSSSSSSSSQQHLLLSVVPPMTSLVDEDDDIDDNEGDDDDENGNNNSSNNDDDDMKSDETEPSVASIGTVATGDDDEILISDNGQENGSSRSGDGDDRNGS